MFFILCVSLQRIKFTPPVYCCVAMATAAQLFHDPLPSGHACIPDDLIELLRGSHEEYYQATTLPLKKEINTQNKHTIKKQQTKQHNQAHTHTNKQASKQTNKQTNKTERSKRQTDK